jgi:RNA polymerase sigma factor (sigma-70 family)
MAARQLVALRGDEADLYATHHAALRRAVARTVNASPALIEDACQAAWAILLRAQPDRSPTLLAWLRTVAVHEAYRLLRRERATVSLDALTNPGAETCDSPADDWVPALAEDRLDEQLEARRALLALASLPARQREYVAWKVAGHSYQEIRELAGGVTYTNVNKHLVRGRRSLRDHGQQAA